MNAKSRDLKTRTGHGPKTPLKRPSAVQFRFGYLMHDVSRLRRTLMDQIMRPLGVTRSQWSILSTLSRGGAGGMTQVDVARLMDIGKATVGGLLDRLETTGHIERRTDADDRRAKRVFITDQGYEVIRLMIKVAAAMNREILVGIPMENVDMAESVLIKVKENIKKQLQEREGFATGAEFGSLLSERVATAKKNPAGIGSNRK